MRKANGEIVRRLHSTRFVVASGALVGSIGSVLTVSAGGSPTVATGVFFVVAVPGAIPGLVLFYRHERPIMTVLRWARFAGDRASANGADPELHELFMSLSDPSVAGSDGSTVAPGAWAELEARVARLGDENDRAGMTALLAVAQAVRMPRQGTHWSEPLLAALAAIGGRPRPKTSRRSSWRPFRRFIASYVALAILTVVTVAAASASNVSPSAPLQHAGDNYAWEYDPQAGGPKLVNDPPSEATFSAIAVLLRGALASAPPPTMVNVSSLNPQNPISDGLPNVDWAPLNHWYSVHGVPPGSAVYNIIVPLGAFLSTHEAQVYVTLSSDSEHIPALDYTIDAATMTKILNLLFVTGGT